jgi:hypothetical protein
MLVKCSMTGIKNDKSLFNMGFYLQKYRFDLILCRSCGFVLSLPSTLESLDFVYKKWLPWYNWNITESNVKYHKLTYNKGRSRTLDCLKNCTEPLDGPQNTTQKT